MNRRFALVAFASLGCLALAAAMPRRDGATILNSGSTNFAGYTIKVWSDGSTSSVHTRHGAPIESPAAGNVPKGLATALLADLKAAKQSGGIVSQSCMKSASFGSTLVVLYHGWTTPDLSCPGDGYVTSVASDAAKIVAALKLSPVPTHRVPMLPNERRRPPNEQTGTPQASALPEPSPSAS